MISNFYGQEQYGEMLRARTTRVLAVSPLPDRNSLLADLAEVGYLKVQPVGCAAALLILAGEEAELFADDMPDESGLIQNGGARFNYESVHKRMIYLNDLMNVGMPHGQNTRMQSGFVLDFDDDSFGGRRFMPKDYVVFESLGDSAKTALAERDITEVVQSNEIADRERYRRPELRSVTEVLRAAARWREHTITPPYNHQTGENISRALSLTEAKRALKAELDSIEFGQPKSGIDIVFEVTNIRG